jgi:superfamily II DNA or RNA helicase
MIRTAIKLEIGDLRSKEKPEHINVTCYNNGNLLALSWLYETKDSGLHRMVKSRGGIWDRNAGGWTFDDPAAAQNFLDAIVKKHPAWPVVGVPTFMPLSGISFSHISVRDGLDACLVPFPLPYFAHISGRVQIFRIATGDKKNEEVGLLIGRVADMAAEVDSMLKQGASCDGALAKKWRLTTGDCKLQAKVNGWTVQIKCDLSNPLHYLAAPEQEYRWEGNYPYATKVAIPWTGTINTTRKIWPSFKGKLLEAGLELEGDDPEAELAIPAAFDASRVFGWKTPAPNGYLLHAYQKEGAQFCASRGMRAMICDEMGVGKTAQAIAAAEAVDAPRILIICPANARYVWEREIQGWGGRGTIQHITSQLDIMDMKCRWHIVTYDLISARVETWRLNNEQEEKSFVDAFPNLAKEIKKKPGGGYPHKVTLDKLPDKVPIFTDSKRVAAWEKMMQRLRGELLEQFLSAGKMLTIMDEAHRAKNKTAKRTKAIQCIAAGETQLLMLTGTPLRNNEHEAAVLLGLLDAEASTALTKERGYTIQDIKDYLNHFMIRRTKAEVLPELPEKTRQRIDIGNLDSEQMQAYFTALDWARESYYCALENDASEAEARQSMRGGIEQARAALGIAKVRGGEVVDLVLEVVENKECCVVFCAHHQVSDDLRAQLEKSKLRVAVVDGRTPQKVRAKIVGDFQDGRLDVFIGGINSAGEAITLTRADTVIFVELDWVPAALLQAEDRIHRVGQMRNCQIIQLVARIPEGDNLDEIMVDLIGSKVARIGIVLDEDTTNIISGSIQSKMYEHLLAGHGQEVAGAPIPIDSLSVAPDANSQETAQEPPAPAAEKSRLGRPKVYIEKAPPTATERSTQSVKALTVAGGKRLMLRLNPEAHEALKIIMTLTGCTQETATINQVLVARKNELLSESTQK